MINTNEIIDEELANGTSCRGLYIKLKQRCQFVKEHCEGYMVNTVYANEVNNIICLQEFQDAKYFLVKVETAWYCKLNLRLWNNMVFDKIKSLTLQLIIIFQQPVTNFKVKYYIIWLWICGHTDAHIGFMLYSLGLKSKQSSVKWETWHTS